MEIEIIMQFVQAIWECLLKRTQDDIEAGLRNPGRREYRAIINMLRKKNDLHGRALRLEASETFLMLTEADAEDIEALMNDARALAEEN